jgi:hypothetical protein
MSLNQNIMIGANDYGANAAVLDAGDAGLSTYPVQNLITPELYLPAKFSTADPTKTWFTLDFNKQRTISLSALLKHNLTYAGTWRIRVYDDLASYPASPVFDSLDMSIFPPVSGFGFLPWGEFKWGGALEEYVEITPIGYNRHSLLPYTDATIGRFLRVDISDPTNTTYPTIGRCWNSYGYQPSLNVSYGAKMIPIDETDVSSTRSGVRHYGRLVKRKAMAFQFELLPIKELLLNIFGPIQLRTGKAGEVLAILQPLDPETWFYESVFGNLTDTEAAEHTFYGHMGTAMTIDEAI